MLIRKIEVFLRKTGMPATKFGRLAARDPRFVLDLRWAAPRAPDGTPCGTFHEQYREDTHAF